VKLVLGSGSPRRKELLAQLGVRIDDVRPPDVDETPLRGETPRDYCNRVTRDKINALALNDGEVGLCGDTTVALGRRIMGKPDDADQAAAFLRLLSGRRHRVITAVAMRAGDRVWQRDVVSQVKVKPLSDAEITAVLATNDWQGKAGGYGIQGPFAAYIPWISGSYSAIMGLPVAETAGLLRAAGFELFKDMS
jgi:septum formation protein